LFYSKHIQTVLKSLFSDQNHDEKGEHDDKSANQVEHDTSDEENSDDIDTNATTTHVESRNKTKEKVHSNGKSRVQLRSARKHKEDDNKMSKAAKVDVNSEKGCFQFSYNGSNHEAEITSAATDS